MSAQKGFAPFVATLGNGPRKALALHCTLAFSGAWAGFSRIVGDEVTLTAPDMPSHGRSDGWDEHASFVETVYEASVACLDEPMDVIGHSFGGAIALRLAVDRPDLVRSLTMIEPVFFCVAKEDNPETVADQDAKSRGFIDAIEAGDMESAARQFNRSWGDGPTWDTMPEQVRAAMTRAIHVVPNTMNFLYEDSANLLSRINNASMPSLLIRGEAASNVVKTTNTGLTRRLPNAGETVIKGAGHMAPVSHPTDVADVWRNLLASA
ncbi:MAG: alpha/beta hydrolase [Aliishimia sp.]